MVWDVLWWFVIIRGGFSLQFSRKYHVTRYLTNQSPRFNIKSHFEWDFMMVCDVLWWFVMICGGSWCFVVVRNVSWWFPLRTTTNHHKTTTTKPPWMWWFVVIHGGLVVVVSWWFVVIHGGLVVVVLWWFVVVRSGFLSKSPAKVMWPSIWPITEPNSLWNLIFHETSYLPLSI